MTPVLLPGNMCDARLWRGGDGGIVETLGGEGAVHDAALASDDSIVDMAARTLGHIDGDDLLPTGFSMGAIVALEMARQAPGRIAGLVLMGLNAGPDLPDRAAHRPRQQAEVRGGGLERVLVEELKPNYLAAANRGDAELLALLRDMGLTLGPDVFVRQSEALRTRDDLTEVLRSVAVPILLLCGAEDALCPPAWHRRWAGLARDATLHVVAGAGHMLPLEAPALVADHLQTWLNERPNR